ncbi:DNA methylase [Mycobacterium phage Necropolis]|uniref:DNA methylase n=4 Tax=Caudoviricetes TaxID=2731619 RepID=A0A143FPZ3_9CAUD|nr:DNA methyltransferase [Mycobacterium phage Malithi]YP_009303815.1 DNA methyltransferase [Mycobacterium phage Shipwreck]YP_009604836.1 DNA methyltransferase [Mycobacterium phage Jebeks]ASD53684.1 DNA methylase [Mycobacterium phage Bogie]QDH85011.1 DNA methylase [Mycobacterium phage HUHilltop]QDH92933.1 DNA methylase [Mycobacterium phage Necropolis]UYL87579.1 DNA methyltransferase [Mycobacterium phage Dynamo]AJF40409.1 DNA methylase [Mycobacterium phage Malithi]
MSIHYRDDQVTVHHGDCLDVLTELPDASVDAVVTDPPYGLEFMGKEWDAPWRKTSASHARARERRAAELDDPVKGKYIRAGVNAYEAGQPFQQWCTQWAAECLRVLKPGGHMLAFGGSRTWHRLAAAIEDAGFEVRDSIAWLYGSGFPKSLDVSKAIDKAAGAEREQVPATGGLHNNANLNDDGWSKIGSSTPMMDGPSPATPEAAQWQGWGTALKPAFEPIVVARKPLQGTVAANVLDHGTGALNIDACRVGDEVRVNPPGSTNPRVAMGDGWRADAEARIAEGRWPTNVVLDEAQAAELDAQTGTLSSGKMYPTHTTAGRQVYGQNAAGGYVTSETYGDSGGASRFFPVFRYEAKAPGAERPSVVTTKLRLRADLTPEQVDHVVARLREAGVEID